MMAFMVFFLVLLDYVIAHFLFADSFSVMICGGCFSWPNEQVAILDFMKL